MSLDVENIARDMISAAKGVVGDRWPATRQYLESESKMYAQRLESVAQMYLEGLISEKRAKEHVAFQNEAWETTLLAVHGMTQLLVEEALNAAIKAVQTTVNKAIGFTLL